MAKEALPGAAAATSPDVDGLPAGQALALIVAAAGGDLPVERVLAALVALCQLRADLDEAEPRLIAQARAAGASWAQLADALGLASRQAAERRFLRRQRPEQGEEGTRDQRVQAVRDRRAGDRAVTAWARANGADLRQLAGQITALTDLGPRAQFSVDRLHDALGSGDAAVLVPLLAATEEHLAAGHAGLADRVAAVGRQSTRIRQDSHQRRSDANAVAAEWPERAGPRPAEQGRRPR